MNPADAGIDSASGSLGAAAATKATGELYLVDIQRLLSLFSEGISGRSIVIETIAETANTYPATSVHRVNGITSDGKTIYLPERLAAYSNRKNNLGAYRIAILHQVGYDACGTFQFRLARAAKLIPGIESRIATYGATHETPPDREVPGNQWRAQPKPVPGWTWKYFLIYLRRPA